MITMMTITKIIKIIQNAIFIFLWFFQVFFCLWFSPLCCCHWLSCSMRRSFCCLKFNISWRLLKMLLSEIQYFLKPFKILLSEIEFFMKSFRNNAVRNQKFPATLWKSCCLKFNISWNFLEILLYEIKKIVWTLFKILLSQIRYFLKPF